MLMKTTGEESPADQKYKYIFRSWKVGACGKQVRQCGEPHTQGHPWQWDLPFRALELGLSISHINENKIWS